MPEPEELNPQTGGSWLRDPKSGQLSPNVPAADPQPQQSDRDMPAPAVILEKE